MKHLLLRLALVLSVTLTTAHASESLRDPSNFHGHVTAIDSAKKQVTVVSPTRSIRIFEVSNEQLRRVRLGDFVTVRAVGSYPWPFEFRTTKVTPRT